METKVPNPHKPSLSIAKAAAFVVSLFFGVAVIVFNTYMYGVFRQTNATLSEHQERMDQLVKQNDAFKDEIAGLRKDNAAQRDALASQKDLITAAQDNTEKLGQRLDEEKDSQRREISRLEEEQAKMKQHIDDIDGSMREDIDGLKKQNKEWQRDYVTVLKNLDKITKELDDKLKSTRADFLGRMGTLETRLNRLAKDIDNQENGVKPSLLHKRLSNDSAGLQDILDVTPPKH